VHKAVEVQFADVPPGNEALGYNRAAILSSDFPAFDPEASRGNPGFDELASGVHC
jgi:hypothetical protein